jgi:hypothetical protein
MGKYQSIEAARRGQDRLDNQYGGYRYQIREIKTNEVRFSNRSMGQALQDRVDNDFDSLVQEGLTAIDSAGIAAKVIQFRVYYKERNLYEDSLGNYYVDTEMLTDFSRGNKLNSYMGGSLVDRTKKGDTAIFDDIVVMLPDSLTVQGCPMTFVIGK